MDTETTMDRWEMLEDPPKNVAETADLYLWSLNYDAGKGPFSLFVDLIGWSEENIGEAIYDLSTPSLGYLELSKLADALAEYANDPQNVRAWVDAIIEAEAE